jgi:uroporphyrin-III C-methyltransferase/precorrin-2 dehydrogenase/sirohydrochlorin ferrochelatase
MESLPVFFKLQGRTCLIAGGSVPAARKAELLLRAGCRLRWVAPAWGEEAAALSGHEAVERHTRSVQAEDFADCLFAVSAYDELAADQHVAHLAAAHRVPVNVVDQPDLCDFIFPAMIDRSPVVVAIGSNGASPVLVRLVKARLEVLLPQHLGRLAHWAGSLRSVVRSLLPGGAARRRFWEQVLEGPLADRVLAGDEAGATQAAVALLNTPQTVLAGRVWLVGAGPGDPELLTLKAQRVMQMADVVLYDQLVSLAILDLTRRDAERLYVGKISGCHSMRQREIEARMIELAREGKRVVRLKGGDPFVFGRGGEELETLTAAGVACEVVPGITAALGAAAAAGIPLTHREAAHTLVLSTAHRREDVDGSPDWVALARPEQTLVFYMGVAQLEYLASALIAHGLPADTPAAIIEQATRPTQRVLTAPLAGLAALARESVVGSPSLVMIGQAVGRRIVPAQAAGLAQSSPRQDASLLVQAARPLSTTPVN